MTIIGVLFWLGWHVIQFRSESAELNEAANNGADKDKIAQAIKRY